MKRIAKLFLVIFNILILGCVHTTYIQKNEQAISQIKPEIETKKVDVTTDSQELTNITVKMFGNDSLKYQSSQNQQIVIIPFKNIKSISHYEYSSLKIGATFGFLTGFVLADGAFANSLFSSAFGLVFSLPFALTGYFIPIETKYSFRYPSFNKIEYGIEWGYSLSGISGLKPATRFSDYNHRSMGLKLGASIYYNFSNNYSVKNTLSLISKGADFGENNFTGDNNHVDLSITQINLASKLLYLPFEKSKISIFSGFFYDYSFYAKQSFILDGGWAYDHNDYEFQNPELGFPGDNFKNEINRHSFGILIGLQFPFYYDNLNLIIEYHQALTNLYKENHPKYYIKYRPEGEFSPLDFTNKNNSNQNSLIISFEYLIR